jgi:hypothetical protein
MTASFAQDHHRSVFRLVVPLATDAAAHTAEQGAGARGIEEEGPEELIFEDDADGAAKARPTAVVDDFILMPDADEVVDDKDEDGHYLPIVDVANILPVPE